MRYVLIVLLLLSTKTLAETKVLECTDQHQQFQIMFDTDDLDNDQATLSYQLLRDANAYYTSGAMTYGHIKGIGREYHYHYQVKNNALHIKLEMFPNAPKHLQRQETLKINLDNYSYHTSTVNFCEVKDVFVKN